METSPSASKSGALAAAPPHELSAVVDWHMHTWLPEQLGEWQTRLINNFAYAAPPEVFEETLQTSGIGHAVIVGLESNYLDLHIPNDFISAAVQRDASRRTGVGSVDPNDPFSIDKLNELAEMGLRGVKLSPPYQNFHPHDPKAWAIYERAAELGLFLLFHQGWVFDTRCLIENANPILLDRVAGAFPKMPIIIAHLGQPWFWETICVMRRRKNVFTDLSARLNKPWQVYNALMAALDYNVQDRVLFGSDFPISSPLESLKLLLNLNETLNGCAPIRPEVLRSIAYERPITLLDR